MAQVVVQDSIPDYIPGDDDWDLLVVLDLDLDLARHHSAIQPQDVAREVGAWTRQLRKVHRVHNSSLHLDWAVESQGVCRNVPEITAAPVAQQLNERLQAVAVAYYVRIAHLSIREQNGALAAGAHR